MGKNIFTMPYKLTLKEAKELGKPMEELQHQAKDRERWKFLVAALHAMHPGVIGLMMIQINWTGTNNGGERNKRLCTGFSLK